MYTVHTIPCVGCGTTATFTMTEEQFNRFESDEHVQNIFPDWSAEDRELLVSGTCPDCWDEMYGEDEDGDDEWEDDDFGYDPLNEDYQDWYVD